MNTEANNRPVRKAATIVGFVALLVVIAWLSIMIVKNVPGSFASLASLAESVRSFDASQVQDDASDDEATPTNTTQSMLIVTSDTNVAETDTNIRLSWTDASTKGTFVFNYECTDGVAVNISEVDGVRNVACNTNYNLGDVNSLVLNISSEKERFVDVAYTLSFLADGDILPTASDTEVVTIVNDTIPLTFDEVSTEEVVTVEVTEASSVESSEEPVEEVGTTPAVTTPTTAGPTFEQEFTYTIPVSDPNGRIDLATRFIDIGTISNKKFVAGAVDNDDAGAIQFEVKNLGTKTSNDWTYSITLPSGGIIESEDQDPLKPNERAVITIGFPASSVTSHDFEVIIDTTGDNTSINDRFIERVTFSN